MRERPIVFAARHVFLIIHLETIELDISCNCAPKDAKEGKQSPAVCQPRTIFENKKLKVPY
jgi:hypothetical protein